MKFHDLGINHSKPTAMEDEDRKFYPSARVPLAAIKGAPQDGKEFTVMAKACVRSVDNRDEAADIEIKGIALAERGASGGSKGSGDTESPVPKRSLSESLKMAAKAGKQEE